MPAKKQQKTHKTKKGKDPNAPKRPLSAYMFFAKEKREEIVRKQPELRTKVAEVGKMIGEAWGKMSEAQKKPFQSKATTDKARYEKEMQVYRKKN